MAAPEITVIDYGLGNLLSVARGFEKCGARITVTADPETILKSSRLVLPGVGAFPNARKLLEKKNLIEVIKDFGSSGKPLLAICLGMQLLMDESEEFTNTAGLGLIPGRVVSIPNYTLAGETMKIPHIGWSSIFPTQPSASWMGTVLEKNESGDSLYFVHSFMAVPTNPKNVIAYCDFGGHRIAAVVARDNIFGCQFHPEKSGENGLKIMQKFCDV